MWWQLEIQTGQEWVFKDDCKAESRKKAVLRFKERGWDLDVEYAGRWRIVKAQ